MNRFHTRHAWSRDHSQYTKLCVVTITCTCNLYVIVLLAVYSCTADCCALRPQ